MPGYRKGIAAAPELSSPAESPLAHGYVGDAVALNDA
jgi:hypothetical protein